jgi:hypothetical protein
MGESGLEFSDFEVAIAGGERRVLVVTPTERIRVGAALLAVDPAEVNAPSPLDGHIVDRIASWPRPIDAVLLRSWGGDEARSWGFDPALDDVLTDALGYRLMQGQLAFFRQVMRHGVFALVATDLSAREFDALVRASLRLGRELATAAKQGDADPTLTTDRWILDHFSLWTTRPFDEFVLQGLPELLRLVDRHRDKLVSLSGATKP